MRRTQKELKQLIVILNNMVGGDYDYEIYQGNFRLTSAKGANNVSPLMKMGELCSWINAFMEGINAASRNTSGILYYTQVAGKEVFKGFTTETERELRTRFWRSPTPISRIIRVNANNRDGFREMLEVQHTNTPAELKEQCQILHEAIQVLKK